jgi:pimeloyl-ACP methyl ester carboxylesterase
MAGSEVRYVNSGGVHIAYRVFGDGPVDLVLVPAFTSHLEQNHEWPGLVRWNARLVSFSRLIVFDKRSTGLSDHAPGPVVLEDTMQDVLAVMDAAGAERPAVCGDLEGAALSALFAATHPERTLALVLYAPLVKGTGTDDFPWALAPELQGLFGGQPAAWGSEPMARMLVDVVAPSLADDQRFLQFMAKAMRSSVSPGAAQAWLRMIRDIDVREALPQIRVPTLLVHRTGDRAVDVGASRYAAGRIPGARLVELPDGDNLPFVGDSEAVAAEIEEFLTGSRPAPMPDRVLATILFTDIAGSTERAAEVGDHRWRELLGRHDTLTRAQLERYRGREVKMTGDGLLATFDGPARAVACATASRAPQRRHRRAGHGTGPAERGAGVQYGEGPGGGRRDRVRGSECPFPPGGPATGSCSRRSPDPFLTRRRIAGQLPGHRQVGARQQGDAVTIAIAVVAFSLPAR